MAAQNVYVNCILMPMSILQVLIFIKVSPRHSILKQSKGIICFSLKTLMQRQQWTLAQMADRAFTDSLIALHSLSCMITLIVRHRVAPFRYCRLKMYRFAARALLTRCGVYLEPDCHGTL